MKHSKYYSNYGRVRAPSRATGAGLTDIFTLISSGMSQLPPSIIKAGKKAATNIAAHAITAVGDRIGRKVANKIAPPPRMDRSSTLQRKSETADQRQEILKDLILDDQYGYGKPKGKTIRGKGIKTLR